MKVEISEESFEALLVYDDLFLDYFNVFLQLPAFPQPLYYNRLTGTFQEVEDANRNSLNSLGNQNWYKSPALYAPGDDERERILDWAKTERLPLFIRTKLFLEYKLCKLLTRPLDERHSISRLSSRGLRGYSRQTVSYTTTTSTSLAQSRAASAYDDESDLSWQNDAERAGLFKYLRPGSRCISLPPMFGLAKSHSSLVHTPDVQSVNPLTNGASSRGKGHVLASDEHKGQVRSPMVNSHMSDEEGNAELNVQSALQGTKSALRIPGKAVSPRKTATIKIPSTSQNSDDESEIVSSGDRTSTEGFTSPIKHIKTPINRIMGHDVDMGDFDNNEGDSDSDNMDVDEEEQEEDEEEEEEEDSFDPDNDPEPSIIDYEEERGGDDERTESQLRQMEGKHKLTLQQLKDHLLGSMIGVEAFKAFLKGTAGEDMLNFWLDCELYRDNMLALGDQKIDVVKTNLFRNIQDKYRFKLTPDAQEQIKKAQGNMGLSESVFTRTQYDVLRRLRSYWVPRFLIHQEYTGGINFRLLKEKQLAEREDANSPQDGFLPSISLVNSLPVRPDSCIRLNTTRKDWNKLANGGRQMEEFIKPGQILDAEADRHVSRPLSARFHVSLVCDKEAGRPFQRYLERQEDSRLLSNLLFWQDVTEYGLAEGRSADRLLRIGQAWSIFSKYLVDGSVWYIGVPPGERDYIHGVLLMTSDFVEASTFERAQNQSMKLLQREWLHFLKDDLKTFLKFRNRPEDQIHSGSSRFSSASRQGRGDATQADLEQKTKLKGKEGGDALAARKKAQKEKKKKQAAMQRKLLKQVKARQANASKQQGQGVKFQSQQEKGKKGSKDRGDGRDNQEGRKDEGEDDEDSSDDVAEDEEDEEEPNREVNFKKMFQNKSLMNVFKNYLQDFESKELNYTLQMYMDVDIALKIPEGQLEKRTNQFKQIINTYFDPSSRKSINLSHDVLMKLAKEGNKPSSKLMEAAHRHAANSLEDAFQGFWSQSGQQMPNAQDKNEFQAMLNRAGKAAPPRKLMAFHRYLIEYGEKEGMPLLDKDLLFYLEAQRLKEAHNSSADLSMLKRKVEVILDCFLESPLVNGGVMIDVPAEVSNKAAKTADNFLKDRGKDPHNTNLFDEAQYTVFKEMISYWAAFTRRYQDSGEAKPRLPSTKRDRQARERLRKFVEMKEPKKEFNLPMVSTPPQSRTGGTGVTFSLSEGLKWKQTFDPGDNFSEDDNATIRSRRSSTIEGGHGTALQRTRIMQSRSNLFSQDSNVGSRAGRLGHKMEIVTES
ncbi:regulator of G-protein signaling 22-like isoform X3 [Apostichopus japonicus]|uniref:regulator of G-protein signaling 22-like isoform X3 n=1 Tax=Stichopus japonicus TaxID=307972 RepID=UPI003AB2BF73